MFAPAVRAVPIPAPIPAPARRVDGTGMLKAHFPYPLTLVDDLVWNGKNDHDAWMTMEKASTDQLVVGRTQKEACVAKETVRAD